ncbi:heparinase II/III family protein [Nitrosococcus watsonii]|uniref:Heparinase II/III family protein n=1 Tax=Nitrosococcus watsoni (strain C-113) TaxID=105559 RepID=D8K6V3_NITWC|nr:alginate lyase family protein [Nitrosococcus watsonii]ADJ28630.1 Heparinase II/III family protein [Nitrosococcus watsonii C-113]
MKSVSSRFRGWFGRASAVPYCPTFSASTAIERKVGIDAEPAFFADSGSLRAAAEQVAAERPQWRARLLERAYSDCRTGLITYGRRGDRLGKAFPWNSLTNGPGEDALYAARPHRFAFAPRLALAILYGAPLEHILAATLEGWMQVASAGCSKLPYLSNFVVIQRFIALSWALAFLIAKRGDAGYSGRCSAVEHAVLKILHADVRFLAPRLGESYPNNHLLLDNFAGWYIGLLFPEFIEERGWLERYESLWLRELARQTYEDGTGFEHSIHYQEYACEMTAAYVILSRRNDRSVPDWTLDRLKRMLAFQIDLSGPETTPLAIGNGTEDPLFPLDIGEGWGCGAIRELYRALFDSSHSPSPYEDSAAERAFWLLGGKLAPSPAELKRSQSFKSYPIGGFFIFSEPDEGTRLVFRTGPAPGKQLMGGHMHADLLGIYVSVAGNPMVVDGGTYTYRSQVERWPPDLPRWRAYFAGPEAHNGLSIRGVDSLGSLKRDFRDREVAARVATTRLIAGAVGAWVEGKIESQNVYDSYCRGVVHVPGEYWLVYDQLPERISSDAASFALQWVPGAKVEKRSSHEIRVITGEESLSITFSKDLTSPQVLEGSLEPLGGWVSRHYGQLEAAPQVRTTFRGEKGLTAFLLAVGEKSTETVSLQEMRGHQGGLAFRIICGERVDYLLLGPQEAPLGIEAWGIRFEGAWLWLRTIAGIPTRLCWLEGQSLQCEAMGLSLRAPERTSVLELRHSGSALVNPRGTLDGFSICWPGS